MGGWMIESELAYSTELDERLANGWEPFAATVETVTVFRGGEQVVEQVTRIWLKK